MLRERVVPQSEVIRAILLEDSPCCGVPHLAGSTPSVKFIGFGNARLLKRPAISGE